MKHIVKQSEPPGLSYAREHHLDWNEFHKQCRDVYAVCIEQANKEQDGECAYTGMPLNSNTEIHIDHFKKKSIYGELTFVWTNLFAAVKDCHYGADYKDDRINGTNAATIYSSLLNPAIETPDSYFWYSNNGNIEPLTGLTDVERQRAETTIRIFNLNSPILVNRRRELFSMLQYYKDLTMSETLSALKKVGFSFVISAFYQYN